VPKLEIYGSEGTLGLPDPNTFGGPVRMRPAGSVIWRDVLVTRPYTKNSRGLGLADMAAGLRSGAVQAHRASGELAYHVLEVLLALERSRGDQRHIPIESRCGRPARMAPDPPG
jgi:predicted dehydrogenase